MLPVLTNPDNVAGSHWQPATGETLVFTGEAWWRQQWRQEQYMAPGMTGGTIAFVIIIGFFFWPLWLLLIGAGSKLAVRQVPAGWSPVCRGTATQIAAARDESQRRELAVMGSEVGA